MRAGMPPHVMVPGDNEKRIMARSGECIGFNKRLAVWRFGFGPGSDSAIAHDVCIIAGRGFLWVLSTRKMGKIKETYRGYAIDLPESFRNVIDYEEV